MIQTECRTTGDVTTGDVLREQEVERHRVSQAIFTNALQLLEVRKEEIPSENGQIRGWQLEEPVAIIMDTYPTQVQITALTGDGIEISEVQISFGNNLPMLRLMKEDGLNDGREEDSRVEGRNHNYYKSSLAQLKYGLHCVDKALSVVLPVSPTV